MERLTERVHEDGLCYGKVDCEDNCTYCDRFLKVLNKLADYEDAEEQGLLLRLPCKVGTKVYYICPHNTISLEKDAIYEGIVTRVYAMGKEILMAIKIHTEYSITEFSSVTGFGERVFLTKEEAEQKLESMQKGE